MSAPNRTIEERQSTVVCLRKGWLRITTPSEQRDRPDLCTSIRVEEIEGYGLFYSYEHPTILGIVIRVDNGQMTVENLPLAEFDAAMIAAES